MSLNDIIKLIIEAIIKAITNPPSPPPQPPSSDAVAQLLKLHNDYRQQKGLKLLTLNQSLVNAAQKHTNWMNQNKTLNHNQGGNGPGDRISAEGYRWRTYGENIAMGYPTAQAVFQGWLNSSGHRANIVNSNFKDVGFGVSGKYWTTDFATSSGALGSPELPGGLEYQEE